MHPDVAIAIDGEAVPVSIERKVGAGYNADGEGVVSREAPATIYAAVQPATGRTLLDAPEGIRSEAKWAAWSRSPMAEDDHLTLATGKFRVMAVAERAEGGFYKAWLGGIK